jgi:hypothetical protein
MLDFLATDRFLTVTDLATGAQATLESHGNEKAFGDRMIQFLKEQDPNFAESDMDRVGALFRKLVQEQIADYLVMVGADGKVKTVGNDWNRMFLRANPEERLDLEQKLDRIEISEAQVQILQLGDIFDEFYENEEYDLYVLKALRIGKISQFQAAKLLDFHELQKQPYFEMQLKNQDGTLNLEDWELLSASMQDISAEKLEKVKAAILDLPPSETQMFLFHRNKILRPEHAWSPLYSVYDLVWESGSAFRMVCKNEEGKDEFLFSVIPPTLHYTVLHAIFGKNAMLANPVCGAFSNPEDFESPTARDAYIPCSFFKTPDRVHEVSADALGIMIHDVLGHLWFEGATPRIPLIRIALLFRQSDPDIWNILLDRVSPIREELSNQQDFWRRLCYIISSIKDIPEEKQVEIFKKIINEIIAHPGIYEQYGITPITVKEARKVERVLDYHRHKTVDALVMALSR